MACVEQVKAAAGEHEALPLGVQLLTQFLHFFDCCGFILTSFHGALLAEVRRCFNPHETSFSILPLFHAPL
jgi:hypothetical protein